ncbi:hypothetical protein [Spiroplasma endosymbiont of Megaselia nigra]|uniref:hypothetical protein n=1 Tax=Spiroplasma endosymbiont of Megaselia nigra TaxID=2478537 RepID=UPI000F865F43|nr:hypothetical protein [Spiroplasma endosymbiont of Megaselia nigra]RUO85832.1 hypothetical protein D9R21_06515 [Spiroplasma endosymbiont of Megaselia nigra]
MKKLLSLLSVLTISGTAVPTTIAASPYQKEEIKNIRIKRDYSNTSYSNTSNGVYYNGYKIKGISGQVKDIIVASSGSAYFLTEDGYVYYLAYSWTRQAVRIDTYYNLPEIRNVKSITADGTRNYYNTSNGVYYSTNFNPTKVEGISGPVRKIIINGNGNIFYDIDTEKVNNLKMNFNNINDNLINLGIIDNNNYGTILNAIKKQNHNLDVSQLEVINKTEYSNFTKNYSAEIKIKHNSIKYAYLYDTDVLKPKIIFNTKDKINELSINIENNSMVKEWLEHINDYDKNLPTKIENLKKLVGSQKIIFKNIEKEIIKSYIRDFRQIITLIEHEWKIEELNNTVQGIKSDINNLNNQINNLSERITNLEKSSSNLNCANITDGVSRIVDVIPVIGSIGSAILKITSGVCLIANV